MENLNMCMFACRVDYDAAIRRRAMQEEIKYKPTVRYNQVEGYPIAVGVRAFVILVDHVSSLVTNGLPATTSTVVSYDSDSGEFTTKNTRYVLER